MPRLLGLPRSSIKIFLFLVKLLNLLRLLENILSLFKLCLRLAFSLLCIARVFSRFGIVVFLVRGFFFASCNSFLLS